MSGKVLWHFSMSLDGFVDGREPGLAWLSGVTGKPGVVDEYSAELGAVLGGRHGHDAYPDALPYGDWQGPVFILTHHPRESIEFANGTSFHFVDATPGEALRLAQEAAGGLDVRIGGGPSVVRDFLQARLDSLLAQGVAPERITLDPGYGFAKTVEQNIALQQRQWELLAMGRPLLVGWSRKSTLGALTGRAVDERLSASVAAALATVAQGARVVRVHDVAATVDALKVWQAFVRPTA